MSYTTFFIMLASVALTLAAGAVFGIALTLNKMAHALPPAKQETNIDPPRVPECMTPEHAAICKRILRDALDELEAEYPDIKEPPHDPAGLENEGKAIRWRSK